MRNPCQCGLNGCRQCQFQYHCGPCAAERKEDKKRRSQRPPKRQTGGGTHA